MSGSGWCVRARLLLAALVSSFSLGTIERAGCAVRSLASLGRCAQSPAFAPRTWTMLHIVSRSDRPATARRAESHGSWFTWPRPTLLLTKPSGLRSTPPTARLHSAAPLPHLGISSCIHRTQAKSSRNGRGPHRRRKGGDCRVGPRAFDSSKRQSVCRVKARAAARFRRLGTGPCVGQSPYVSGNCVADLAELGFEGLDLIPQAGRQLEL